MSWNPVAVPTGGRDPLARRMVRTWLRQYVPAAERRLSPEGWQTLDELLRHGRGRGLSGQLRRIRDPYLQITGARWRALRDELREAQAEGRRAAKARQAAADAELMAYAQSLLDGWQPPSEVSTAQQLFFAYLVGLDADRAGKEFRRLAKVTHPDHDGNPRAFAELSTAMAERRGQLG
jgi:hypothetical protein